MSQLLDLARPFPHRFIKGNPSGGGVYVPHPLYTQRLLLYLGGYSFERVEVIRGDVPEVKPLPKDQWTDKTSNRKKYGAPHLPDAVVGCVCRLSVTVDGRELVIEDVGDCEDPHNWPHDGARLKDAMSDALKRCARHVGLGLHLYAKKPDEYVLFDLLNRQDQPKGVTEDGEITYAPGEEPFE